MKTSGTKRAARKPATRKPATPKPAGSKPAGSKPAFAMFETAGGRTQQARRKTEALPRTALGARLDGLMRAKGLGARQLGRASGVAHSTICDLLSGRQGTMHADKLARLAGGLGVTTAQLMGETPVAAPAAPAAGASVPEAGDPAIRLLQLVQIDADPNQPRKSFDDASLDELAASIAEVGLLENLIVRPITVAEAAGTGAVFRLIAGERRWRALHLLAQRGQWDAGARAVPARVIDADAATARAIALVENLQREDVPPLEEGRAFVALREIAPETWTTAAIAARIGKTQRYVQQRMALVTKLLPAAQEMVATGALNVERARELAAAAPAEQKKLLKKMCQGVSYLQSPGLVRDTVRRGWIPVERAGFDVDASGLETVEEEVVDEAATEAAWDAANDGNDGDEIDVPEVTRRGRFFTDPAAFMKAQKKAALAKVEELKAKWAWARFEASFDRWRYDKSKAKSVAGAVVTIDRWTHQIEVHEGLVGKPKEARPGAGPRNENSEAARAERERAAAAAAAAAAAREARLRAALAARPGVAMRLLALALLAPDFGVPLDGGLDYRCGARLAPWARKFGPEIARQGDGPHYGLFHGAGAGPADFAGKAWAALAGLSDANITTLLVDTVCDALDTDVWGCEPLVAILAAELGVPMDAAAGDEEAGDAAAGDETAEDGTAEDETAGDGTTGEEAA